jgi:spoIIIJ-associated protein
LDGVESPEHLADDADQKYQRTGAGFRPWPCEKKKVTVDWPPEIGQKKKKPFGHMPTQPKAILEELLKRLGFEATVEEHPLEDGVFLDVKTDDSGRLIGRQGQTLSDLQYVTNRILFQEDQNSPKVLVDVGGYRAKARDTLVQKAQAAAEKVRRWGDIVEMEPMSAFDRRIIYNSLKDDPGIEAASVEVEGTTKKAILLRPKH